ncbi:MAG: helix-turn-helix domain-containing protein [Desulfatiglans sp.]|nr:helix-turn-helix domain-containing protein [Desulfatiglans sp.]
MKYGNQNIGQEILDGIKEIKRFKKGEISLSTHTLSEPSAAKAIRKRLKLSQSAFAGLMGVSPRTIQDWEQGRRSPQGPAKSLLRIAEQHPEVFLDIR